MFVNIGLPLLLLFASAALVVWGSICRARRRVITVRFGLTLFVGALAYSAYAAGRALQLTFSDNLQVVSILASVAIGFIGGYLDRVAGRMTVGVVIPSRVAFHQELRRGLRDGLRSLKIRFVDQYADTNCPIESLSDFLPCFRAATARRPDYLVVAAPSVSFLDEPGIRSEIERIAVLGGRIFFIEHEPRLLRAVARKRVATIRSDSRAGAQVMAKYVASRWDRKAIVLLLDGPLDSEPARVRLAIFQEILDDTSGLLSLGHAESFSEMAAYHVAAAAIREPQRPGILVCANDSMAIGAARAVSEAELSKCIQVFGYDGIPRALHAIAEPSNPLQATIRIPPSQYGIEIAAQIVADNEASRLRRPRVESKMIPITASNLVTIHNAEEVISD